MAKQSNTPQDLARFRESRNFYNSKIIEAKANCEKEHASKPQDRENLSSKKWWRIAKSFLKKDTGNSSSPTFRAGYEKSSNI